MTDPSTDTTGSAHFGRGPVESFWDLARFHAKMNTAPSYFGPTTLEMVPPPAWAFGATEQEADELLALVLAGTKTATASAHTDYELEDEPLPQPGTLGIVLDGAGHPRALVETTDVRVVAFDQVDVEHAHLEGEGDRSLEHWRAVHERFFTEHAADGFDPQMLLVLERFRVVYAGD